MELESTKEIIELFELDLPLYSDRIPKSEIVTNFVFKLRQLGYLKDYDSKRSRNLGRLKSSSLSNNNNNNINNDNEDSLGVNNEVHDILNGEVITLFIDSCLKIHNKYIKNDSPFEVNVSSKLKKRSAFLFDNIDDSELNEEMAQLRSNVNYFTLDEIKSYQSLKMAISNILPIFEKTGYQVVNLLNDTFHRFSLTQVYNIYNIIYIININNI